MKVSKQRPSLDQPTVLSRYSIDIKMDVSPTSDYYNLSKLSLEPNRFEPNNQAIPQALLLEIKMNMDSENLAWTAQKPI